MINIMFNLFKEKSPPNMDSATAHTSEQGNPKFGIYFMLILSTILSLSGILLILKKYLTSRNTQFPSTLLTQMQQLTVQLQEAIDATYTRIQTMNNLLEESERQFQEGEKEKAKLKAMLAALENNTEPKAPANFLEQRHAENMTKLIIQRQIFTKLIFSQKAPDKGLSSIAPVENPTPKVGLIEILELFVQKHQRHTPAGFLMQRLIRLCRLENDAIVKLLADSEHIAANSLTLINTVQEQLNGTKETKEKQKKLLKK